MQLRWVTLIPGLLLGTQPAAAVIKTGMVIYTDRPQYNYGNLILKNMATGTTQTLVTRPNTTTNWEGAWGASFSPDGKKIAYAYNYTELYTMNIDGSGKKRICGLEGKEQYITWTADNYLWWSQCDKNIYRVKADGSAPREIMYTANWTTAIHNLGMSQDAKIGTFTYPTWKNAGYDFSTKTLYNTGVWGVGCHDPCSPDGKLNLYNTAGHKICYVNGFPSQTHVYTITPIEPNTTQNLFRWSHSSNDIVMIYVESSAHCYLHDLKNDQPNQGTLVGTGIAWDYFAGEAQLPGKNPVIKLSAPSLAFFGQIGGSAYPTADTVEVTNDVPNTTLPAVTVSGQNAWLTTSVAGSGNNQKVIVSVNMARITAAVTVKDTITISATGAAPAECIITLSAFTQRAPDNPANATEQGLLYSYFQGAYTALPNFGTLSAATTDTIGTFSLTAAARADNYALQFTGYINITTAGTYTFYLNSDEGSRLSIGKIVVVDNNGVHTAAEKSGSIGLQAGKHQITVDYFQASGAQLLIASYLGPGVAKTAIPRNVLWHAPMPVRVLKPVAGTSVRVLDTLTIAWNADCQQVPGVKVEISLNSGLDWGLVEESGTLKCGDQTFKWVVPSTLEVSGSIVPAISDNCIVKVANYNGSGEGVSALFKIVPSNAVRLPVMLQGASGIGIRVDHQGRISIMLQGAAGMVVQICQANGAIAYPKTLLERSGTRQLGDRRFAPGLYIARVWKGGRQIASQRFMVE